MLFWLDFFSRSLKLDLLSSIFQNLYPTEQDCVLVCQFMSCPASLEEKYTMIRLSPKILLGNPIRELMTDDLMVDVLRTVSKIPM